MTALEKKLRAFVGQLKREEEKWTRYQLTCDDRRARPRYEGIATGYRWARCDLECLLKTKRSRA